MEEKVDAEKEADRKDNKVLNKLQIGANAETVLLCQQEENKC